MTGIILRNLLDSQKKLCIPGLGVFTSEARSAEIQFGANTITPPLSRIDFSPRHQDTSSILRDHLVSRYGMPASRADAMTETFIADIRNSLAGTGKHTIPAFGTLSSDMDGNIQFSASEDQLFCLSSFGLKPVSAVPLALHNRISSAGHEVPVIPLRPFDRTETKRTRMPALALAAIGTGLAILAGSVLWLSNLNPEAGQQASVLPVSITSPAGGGVSPSESGVLASGTPTSEEAEKIPVPAQDAGMKFYVIAGSFRNLLIASQAEKDWSEAGFQTSRHALPEKEMSRVAIGEFASREDALSFIEKAQPSFDANLWILKEQ